MGSTDRIRQSVIPRLELQALPLPILLQELKVLTMPLTELTGHLSSKLEENLIYHVEPPRSSGEWERWEERLISNEPLKNDLIIQMAALSTLKGKRGSLSRELVDWLDHRGYLAGSEEDIAVALRLDLSSLGEILDQARSFLDPPGIFARDLPHCLTLQLCRKGKDHRDSGILIRKASEALASGGCPEASLALGWTEERTKAAIEELSHLDPCPGRTEKARPIVPEVALYPDGTRTAILLEENLPTIRMTPIEWDDRRIAAMNQEGIKVVKDMARRYGTKTSVALALGEAQKDYLTGVTPAPGSVTLRDIGERTGHCLSTVQRTASSTWAVTPRGTMLLSDLFSRPLKAKPDMSVAQLRWTIREKLSKKETDRTMAKSLGIPLRTVSWHRLKLNDGEK